MQRNLGQQNIGNRLAFVGIRALDTGSALKKAFPSQTLRDLATRRAEGGGGEGVVLRISSDGP